MKNKINSRSTASANLICAFIFDFFLLKEFFEIEVFLFCFIFLFLDLSHGPGVYVSDSFEDGFDVESEFDCVCSWFRSQIVQSV